MAVCFQNSVDAAKPLLRKAIQISQQTPYWHCRLLFQLAVRTVGPARCTGAGWVGGSLGWASLAAVEEPAGQVGSLEMPLHPGSAHTALSLGSPWPPLTLTQPAHQPLLACPL